MDEDKVLTSAVIYLLDGKEVDAAKVLSACSLGYRVTNFYFQLGGEDKADSVLIDLACPRVVYEILQNNTNPIREAIVAAIEACLPTNYIFENLIAHVEYIDLAPGLLSELMTIADGKDADMELSADQRLYLQTIFDYFHEYGKWPTYRYVDRKLTQIRRDLDIEEIPKSLPLGFATAFAFNHDLNADAVLSVSAIYVCGGSEEDLADFAKTLIFCVERYFSAEEDAVEISSDDLVQQLGMSDLSVRKVGFLIKDANQYPIYHVFGGKDSEYSGWTCTLSRNIRYFDGVESIEQYLEKLNQLRKTPDPTVFSHAELEVDKETSVKSNQHTISGNLANVKLAPSAQQYTYDVALSYAGEDRKYADGLAETLRHRGLNVFYDKYEKSTLWGKNLYTYLSDVYQHKARYCVVFLSQHYAAKLWTNHEREAAQARAFSENEEYILPVRLDDTKIPGIPPTVAYLSWPPETAETIADAIVEKLGKSPQVPGFKERTVMDWLVTEAQAVNGKVSIDLGDIPGVKHSMYMTKDNKDWEVWFGQWFHDEFTTRMGFEPSEESVRYALEKYAEVAE